MGEQIDLVQQVINQHRTPRMTGAKMYLYDCETDQHRIQSTLASSISLMLLWSQWLPYAPPVKNTTVNNFNILLKRGNLQILTPTLRKINLSNSKTIEIGAWLTCVITMPMPLSRQSPNTMATSLTSSHSGRKLHLLVRHLPQAKPEHTTKHCRRPTMLLQQLVQ